MSLQTITIKDGGAKYNTSLSKIALARLGITLMKGMDLSEEEVLNQEANYGSDIEFKFEVNGLDIRFVDDLKVEHIPLFVYCLIAPLMNEEDEETEDE